MDLPSREFSRLQIKPLDSSANWLTWRYRVEILLRHYPGALDIVEGRTSVPVSPTDATDAQRKQFEDSLVKFRSAETSAMILLTANMSDSLTERLITIKEPRVLWLELHRLFGGVQETKAYDLCTKFFRFQPRDGDDMAAQLSEVKAIWSSLKAELAVSDSTVSLPEMFLICKILDMLPEKYDTFKQNWAMFPQASRTVDTLVVQLCAHEKLLSSRQMEHSGAQEVFAARTDKVSGGSSSSSHNSSSYHNSSSRSSATSRSSPGKTAKKKPSTCNYCGKGGHWVKECRKWIADGRPPKSAKPGQVQVKGQGEVNTVRVHPQERAQALSVTSEAFFSARDRQHPDTAWYVDNGATNHITYDRSLFSTFEQFDKQLSLGVTTANGEKAPAVGKGTIEIEAVVDGKSKDYVLTDVWLVPSAHKNLFSVLCSSRQTYRQRLHK